MISWKTSENLRKMLHFIENHVNLAPGTQARPGELWGPALFPGASCQNGEAKPTIPGRNRI
jgi:hypothetical protein